MNIAQTITSMVLGLRRKVNIKVRQPLNKIMIPVLDEPFKEKIEGVKDLILNEVNVKSLEYIHETEDVLIKKIKPDFKVLGPKYGKLMKQIAGAVSKMSQQDIGIIEKEGKIDINLDSEPITLERSDVEIVSEDIPGWLVATEGTITVALDIKITDDLRNEGIARELVNRIQNLRKENDFEVTDKIQVTIENNNAIGEAMNTYKKYVASQTLANNIQLSDSFTEDEGRKIELTEDIIVNINITKDE